MVSLDSRAPATAILLRGSDCDLVVRLRTHMTSCTPICLCVNSRGRNDCPTAICTVYVECTISGCIGNKVSARIPRIDVRKRPLRRIVDGGVLVVRLRTCMACARASSTAAASGATAWRTISLGRALGGRSFRFGASTIGHRPIPWDKLPHSRLMRWLVTCPG